MENLRELAETFVAQLGFKLCDDDIIYNVYGYAVAALTGITEVDSVLQVSVNINLESIYSKHSFLSLSDKVNFHVEKSWPGK